MVAADRSLEAGVCLGPYEIVAFLAAGGMGEIYSARDTRLNRPVAVKVLPVAWGTDRDRLARFEKEARAASQLAHPNILTVYDIGDQGGLPYMVTELLVGRTLSRMVQEQPLAMDQIMDIAVQIARGLTAAHEKRIVHRDLKPANVFVTTSGHVKILDFGLAKLIHDEWQTGTTDETQSLISRPGVIVGSAGYMSPEQVEGAAADLRSDVFSFGSILYEMITGRRAFKGESAVEAMAAILRDEPPPIERADCMPELIAVVNRCLAKRPDQRFPSASEVLFALQQVAITASAGMVLSDAHGAGTNRVSGRIAAALAVVATATLLVSGVQRMGAGRGRRPYSPLHIGRIERLTSDGRAVDAVTSPDAAFLAYTTLRQEACAPRLRHIATGSDVELVPPRQDRQFNPAAFSPDGSFVYLREFTRSASGSAASPWDPVGLVRVPLLGGTPESVQPGWFSKFRFSPDGTRVAFVRRQKDRSRSVLVVADPYLNSERVLGQLANDSAFSGDPAWSGDSRHLLIAVSSSRTAAKNAPLQFDLATGTSHSLPLCSPMGWPRTVDSAPDGGWIAQSGPEKSQLWHVSEDGSKCTQLTDETMQWQLGGAQYEQKSIVAVGTQERRNLWRIDMGDTGPPRLLTQGLNTADAAGGVAVLADGRIVLARNATGKLGRKTHLWILERDGRLRQLTNGQANDAEPVAAPDGKTIVYRARQYEPNRKVEFFQLRALNVDTAESHQITRQAPANDLTFSPDGRSVYYSTHADSNQRARLQRVSVSGDEPEDVTPPNVDCASIQVSPDATMASCTTARAVTIVSLTTGRAISTFTMSPTSAWPQWLPDSSAVTFIEHARSDLTNVWSVPARGGQPRRLVSVGGDPLDGPYAWARDGKTLISARTAQVSDVFLLHLETDTSSAKRPAR